MERENANTPSYPFMGENGCLYGSITFWIFFLASKKGVRHFSTFWHFDLSDIHLNNFHHLNYSLEMFYCGKKRTVGAKNSLW